MGCGKGSILKTVSSGAEKIKKETEFQLIETGLPG